ncbi:MAG TPA: NlpC/P60 family protein [Polyangiales bacterium]|nr:NlpC/P60 family protein [Polyangiales bacterium]
MLACNRAAEPGPTTSDGARAPTANCPARGKAPAELPNTPREVESLDYWLGHVKDELLLDEQALAVQEQALRTSPDVRFVDLAQPLGGEPLRSALRDRLRSYRDGFAKGQYKSSADPKLLEDASFVEQHELRVALAPLDLRCVPFQAAIQAQRGSEGFDRNRCSQARAQEPIELLGQLHGMWLARTVNAFGFIAQDAPLSPAVSNEAYRALATRALLKDLELEGQKLTAGTLLRGDDKATLIATRNGVRKARALTQAEAADTARPLTRHAFLREAFEYLRSPYGWGDENGGRDCSRFVLDVMATFGLGMPRTSVQQSRTGRYTIDVPAGTSDTERLALLDTAAERGVVLAHFPGHILIYLGRDKAGVPRALHSFAEYVVPCPGGGETLLEVNRVAVSDLSLGAHSSRKSFLERITQLTVFGKAPGYELLALSTFRPTVPPTKLDPKQCKDSEDIALFRTPREPDPLRPLRVVAVTREDQRPAALFLVSPSGTLISPPQNDLGVGPYSRWIEQANPEVGKWRALLADGDRVLACEEFRVANRPVRRMAPAEKTEAPAWTASAKWERDTEALYAAFVEQLFSHPVADLRSWSSLSELLQKPERNLLFDHRGLGEDVSLKLAPDCADLPYLLRAYFAWKLSLPFAFHTCSRGRAGAPPKCNEVTTNEVIVKAADDLGRFEQYWRKLRDGVHSASGRTLPDDPVGDLYPIELERRTLMPGTVYTDPYGHMIVVGKWIPQGLAGEGMLMGADAQPDATVGRRRFWRGNFLFNPDTTDVGAGFKRYRPISSDKGELRVWTDEEIAASRDFPKPSKQQYSGTLDDFYTRMDQQIYPRPVAVLDRMKRVVDALFEQTERRVEAIDVGVAGLKSVKMPIAMPDGYSIFETSGAWEDFATPSRDMRLLIAIDAVRAFPAQVRAAPQRFGVQPGSPELTQVDKLLEDQLAQRKFKYTRTDGSPWELSLADVVARVPSLETAYNPNDCIESRWGAKEGSPERAPCTMTAPPEQRAALEKYRPWFHDRKRPARP